MASTSPISSAHGLGPRNVAPPPASTAAGGYASVLGSAVSAVAVRWTTRPRRNCPTQRGGARGQPPNRGRPKQTVGAYRLVWDWLVRMVLVVSFGA